MLQVRGCTGRGGLVFPGEELLAEETDQAPSAGELPSLLRALQAQPTLRSPLVKRSSMCAASPPQLGADGSPRCEAEQLQAGTPPLITVASQPPRATAWMSTARDRAMASEAQDRLMVRDSSQQGSAQTPQLKKSLPRVRSC